MYAHTITSRHDMRMRIAHRTQSRAMNIINYTRETKTKTNVGVGRRQVKTAIIVITVYN